jgi:hypothetical protein
MQTGCSRSSPSVVLSKSLGEPGTLLVTDSREAPLFALPRVLPFYLATKATPLHSLLTVPLTVTWLRFATSCDGVSLSKCTLPRSQQDRKPNSHTVLAVKRFRGVVLLRDQLDLCLQGKMKSNYHIRIVALHSTRKPSLKHSCKQVKPKRISAEAALSSYLYTTTKPL